MRVTGCALYFIEVPMRVPLKFGAQTLTEVTCARVEVSVEAPGGGRMVSGWGETPLSVAWVWPSTEIPYEERHRRMVRFSEALAEKIGVLKEEGHAFEIGHAFIENGLQRLVEETDSGMPHLAALVCFSAFDLALHDAFGRLHDRGVFETLTANYLGRDLSSYLEPSGRFANKYPSDYLKKREEILPVWHLVGGLDPLEASDLTGAEPDDGYPVLLREWIRRDGLRCLKIKLRGNDREWDYDRLVRIGNIAADEGVDHLTADFNCTVRDPDYVNGILDQLSLEHPTIHAAVVYVEQPFPYDLEANPIDVTSLSQRKPLYLDESAHDWRYVRMGKSLGWTGVALKTCKTLTGAILSLCWAREHGMGLMVQDLTNPMLAQIPHVLLAAHAGTIMGVESNGMQFYPDASLPEESVHPGLYRRRGGILDLSTLDGPGFGYRIDEIPRELPPAAVRVGSVS